jgi:integrase
MGTANFLIGLGAGAYLEIIGPDPDQPQPVGGRWFGIDRLTAPRIAAFYSELLADGRRDGKGLAPKTVRNIHALLHRALKDAARWGYVPHNRADDVDPPHGTSPERQVWSPEQLRAFLTHVRDDRLYALWILVATTGMRRAELAGLRWSDIDFTRARLTPRLPRVAVNYQVHESDTKTPSGRRSLALDPATLQALGEHRRRQAEERAVIELADTNDLVFTWPDGRPLHPDLITDWFQRHAKRVAWDQAGRTKVGLPGIRLHDLRHTWATLALAAGVPLVCIPMGRDQKDNTARVLRLGAGIRLSKKSTPPQIAAAITEILERPQYLAAARRFAEVLAWEAAHRPGAADEAESLVRL